MFVGSRVVTCAGVQDTGGLGNKCHVVRVDELVIVYRIGNRLALMQSRVQFSHADERSTEASEVFFRRW